MSKKTFCNIIRIVPLFVTLMMLRLLYGIGVIGYVVVCLSCIAWSFAELIEESK